MSSLPKTEEGKSARRSSPHPSDEDSTDSDSDGGMRVGSMYQAVVPELKTELPMGKMDGHDAILIWAPHHDLTNARIDEYIHIAKEKHGYNTEQALGMLFWHKHNVDKALADLPNFTPFPDEWSVEDKVLFEQAFSFHGKSFHRIRQMLPDKSIASLVRYYYSWKKTRSRTSLMDRQAKKLANHADDESDGGSEYGSGNSDSDFDQNAKDSGKDGEKIPCSNCGMASSQLQATPKGQLCGSCYQYWRRTGVMRSGGGPIRKEGHSARHNPLKNKRKPPRGMYLNTEDIANMQAGTSGQADAILKQLDAEVITLKHQVRNNKQTISNGKATIIQGIDSFRPPETATRINARWTNEELLLAVQGVRKYGKDFKAIAELIGNKTEPHVRSFFVNYRRRYNLDEVLAEYEAEYGPDETKETEKTQAEKEKNGAADSAAVVTAEKESTPAVNGTGPTTTTSKSAPSKPHQRLLPSPRSSAPPPLVKPGPAHTKPQPVTSQS